MNILDSSFISLFGVFGAAMLYFIPGALIIKSFCRPLEHFENVFAAFVVSHVFNFFLTNILVISGWFRHKVILILYFSILALFLYLERGFLKAKFFHSNLGASTLNFEKISKLSFTIILSFFCLHLIYENLGQVFVYWDAAVSWNRWAEDWFHGIYPRFTWNYPQLIPANWSLFYQFLGTPDFQTFPKSFMPVFFVGIVFSLIHLSYRLSSWVYCLAAGICTFIYLKIFNPMLVSSGYVDIPVTCFSWLSIYFLFLATQLNESKKIKNYIALSLTCIVAAALTKQVGLYMFAIHPFILFYILGKKNLKAFQRYYLFSFAFCLAALVLPFYAGNLIRMQGTGQSWEFFDYLTKLQDAGGFWGQFIFGYEKALVRYKIPGTFLIALLIITSAIFFLGLRNKINRVFFFSIVLPIFILWLLFFSYQLRNLSIVVPFASICVATGLLKALKLTGISSKTSNLSHNKAFRNPKLKTPSIKNYQVILIIFACLFMLVPRYNKNELAELQQERLLGLGNPEINRQILELYRTNKLTGRILSGYEYFAYLPELRYKISITNFKDPNLDKKRITEPFYDVQAVLISTAELRRLDPTLQKLLQDRTQRSLFTLDNYSLFLLEPLTATSNP